MFTASFNCASTTGFSASKVAAFARNFGAMIRTYSAQSLLYALVFFPSFMLSATDLTPTNGRKSSVNYWKNKRIYTISAQCKCQQIWSKAVANAVQMG